MRVSSKPEAMTVANPACKCQRIWQWKNQGPGFAVENLIVVPAAPTPATFQACYLA